MQHQIPRVVHGRLINPEAVDTLVDLRPGWCWIVEFLDKELSDICPDYRISVISSSRGRLKVFTNYIGRVGYKIVEAWEELSTHICEVCGDSGKAYGEGLSRHIYCFYCHEISEALPDL